MKEYETVELWWAGNSEIVATYLNDVHEVTLEETHMEYAIRSFNKIGFWVSAIQDYNTVHARIIMTREVI